LELFEKDIEACVKTLNEGGLILYPTDTIWGIGCDATNPIAVQKVFDLKGRAENKALIVLLADEKDLLKYVAAIDLQIFDYLETRTKPTTVIYNGALGLADNLIADDGSVGIRICKDDFCKHLIKRFRKPIVSTSANISGEKSPAQFSDISSVIKTGVDYQVNWRSNENKPASASSIIKWENGNVTIIRE
jgi:L-threonylcarbamoyladenylate synthase